MFARRGADRGAPTQPAGPRLRDAAGPRQRRRDAAGNGAVNDLPRWRVFPALALGTLMAILDISIVNIALPTLSRTFHAPLTSVEWVVLAYVVTITGVLLTLGRLADLVGRRRVYAAGMALFTAASALCAAAPSAAWLVAARAVQGLGAAMMTANSSALLVSNFPPAERGRALGAFGALVGVGLALGPPLGGLILAHASWRWIFLINLPLGIAGYVLVRARVPADPGSPGTPRPPVLNALLWSGVLVTAMLALSRGPSSGWGSPLVLGLAGAAVALLVVFAVAERRARVPLLPLDLLKGGVIVAATLTLIGQALSIAIGFHLPLYLEEVLGFTPGATGRWFAVMPLLALFAAPLAGRWSDRIGTRPPSIVGLALACAGLVVLASLGTAFAPARLFAGLALAGGGLGLFTVPNASALFGAAPEARTGAASGLQATMRNLGIAGGAAGIAAVVASRYRTLAGIPLAAAGHGAMDRAAFARATHDAFLGLAVLAAVAALLAVRQPSSRTGAPV